MIFIRDAMNYGFDKPDNEEDNMGMFHDNNYMSELGDDLDDLSSEGLKEAYALDDELSVIDGYGEPDENLGDA